MTEHHPIPSYLVERIRKRGHNYISLLRCPQTGKALIEEQGHVQTEYSPNNGHSHHYYYEDGILRLLTADQRAEFDTDSQRLTEQYQSEERAIPSHAEFRTLPQSNLEGWANGFWQQRTFCTAEMWRILEEIRIDNEKLPIALTGRAVDLTDGMGWIAYALDVSGYSTIALGQNAGIYGLGAFPISRYLRIQASQTAPPLVDEKFDLVVYSFSFLDIRNPDVSLENARNLLQKYGHLLILSDEVDDDGKAKLDHAAKTLNSLGFGITHRKVGAMGSKLSRTMKNIVRNVPNIPPIIVAQRLD
jgi:SAM-dependent methyltransferase